MAVLRSVVVNIGWLGAAQMLDYALRAVIAVTVARYLGVEQYGVFAPALSLALIAAVFADLGLRMSVLKAGSSTGGKLTGVATYAFGSKSLLVLVVYSILLLAAAILGFKDREFYLVAILGAGIFLGSFSELFSAILQAKEKMTLVSAVTAGFRMVLLASVLLAVVNQGDVMAVAWAYAVANLLGAILSGALALPFLLSERFIPVPIKPLIAETFQFGLAAILAALLLQADIVMLRLLHPQGQIESGLYAAVFRLIALLYGVTIVVQAAVIPRLYKYSSDKAKLEWAYRILLRWSLAASVILSAVSVVLAPALVTLFFGLEYLPAWPAMAVLALSLCPHQLNYACGDVLYALGRQGWRATALAATVCMNIVLNLFLIPRYGAVGAAASTLVSELFLLVMLFVVLQKNCPVKILQMFSVPIILAAALGLVLWLIRDSVPTAVQFGVAVLGTVLALVALFSFRYLRLDELFRNGGKEKVI